jgi:hypothetical protein
MEGPMSGDPSSTWLWCVPDPDHPDPADPDHWNCFDILVKKGPDDIDTTDIIDENLLKRIPALGEVMPEQRTDIAVVMSVGRMADQVQDSELRSRLFATVDDLCVDISNKLPGDIMLRRAS